MKTWISGRILVLGMLGVALAACGSDDESPVQRPSDAGNPADDPSVASRTWPSVPVFGGTMVGDDEHLVVADPARTAVGVWNSDGKLLGVNTLETGLPFRVALTDTGFLVTVRRAGDVAAYDFEANLLGRVPVCPEPRGIDVTDGVAVVACASGELVELDAGTLEVRRSVFIDTDLRDVVVDGANTWVSRFRSAEVLKLSGSDWNIDFRTVPEIATVGEAPTVPHVGWRMKGNGEGGVTFLHQGASEEAIDLEPGTFGDAGEEEPVLRDPYGGVIHVPEGCVANDVEARAPLVATHLTTVHPDGTVETSESLPNTVLATDFVNYRGDVLLAGGRAGRDLTGVSIISRNEDGALCTEVLGDGIGRGFVGSVAVVGGTPVAFARGTGDLLLGGAGEWDPLLGVRETNLESLELFHRNDRGGITCAGCHPEATQDGHTWNFEQLGLRRTQDLTGGLVARAPFHWDGEFTDAEGLMVEVLRDRMSGPWATRYQTEALFSWINDMPAEIPTAVGTEEQVTRGQAVFERADVGCVNCHNGVQGSDHQLYTVVGDEPTKTPSLLGVAYRAPFMHDGCAPTLHARFTDEACGGGDAHGTTSHLSATEIDDLVAYLTTL